VATLKFIRLYCEPVEIGQKLRCGIMTE